MKFFYNCRDLNLFGYIFSFFHMNQRSIGVASCQPLGIKIMVDKSWMHLSTRSCTEYINGVENFLEYAFKHSIDEDMKINCSCIDCSNRYRRTRDEV